jgi:hypothetical protein
VQRLAGMLMERLALLVPVLPVSLVAEAVLAEANGQSEFDLKARVLRRIETLQGQGAVVMVPSRTRAHTIEQALHMLKLRRLVLEADGLCHADPGSLEVLRYYANTLGAWAEARPVTQGAPVAALAQ